MLAAAMFAAGVMMVWLGRDEPGSRAGRSPDELQRDRRRDRAVAGVAPNQARQMAELSRRHRRLLTRYEWADSERKIARIPIDRAMELLAENRLNVEWSRDPPENGNDAEVPAAKSSRRDSPEDP
jgi:hypothetical protein